MYVQAGGLITDNLSDTSVGWRNCCSLVSPKLVETWLQWGMTPATNTPVAPIGPIKNILIKSCHFSEE